VGAGIRHVFNLHNKGRMGEGFWIMPAAALAMCVLFYVTLKV
jgi:hypothetical protein